jgi:EF-P beta-lysylation protein EpmB
MHALSDWKIEYRSAFRTVRHLIEAGLVPENQASGYGAVLDKYALFLPVYYANLIDKADPACPIRLQAIPQAAELENPTTPVNDPLGDLQHRPVPRITHRYGNRALLHLTVNCPMYCRYCFRKSLLNEDANQFFDGRVEEALGYIEGETNLEEIILSGGDPLMVSDSLLGETLSRLGRVKHLKRIRIHSRTPVTMPSRVDAGLLAALRQCPLPVVFVTHFNHPREWTEKSRQACLALKPHVHSLLNQSVLLRGVNDSAATLQVLNESIFEAGVLPYYLHQLDQARGTLHFEVPVERGKAIVAELKARLPGYLVPRYVVDTGDRIGKTWLV